MKTKLVLFATLIIAVLGLGVYSVIRFVDVSDLKGDDSASSDSNESNSQSGVLTLQEGEIFAYYTLANCSLYDTVSADGVVNYDLEQICDCYQTDEDSAECYFRSGDEVSEGDVIFSFGDTQIKAEHDGIFSELQKYDSGMTAYVINPEKLNISVRLSLEEYNVISYDTKVEISTSAGVINGKIEKIGTVIVDNRIEVVVKPEKYIIPGSKTMVVFYGQPTGEMLFVPEQFVNFIGNYATCYRFVNDGQTQYEEVEITIGKRYDVNEDGEICTYYSVIDGLQEGEQIFFFLNSHFNEDIVDNLS